jgi:YVTN family beta-propeller protein
MVSVIDTGSNRVVTAVKISDAAGSSVAIAMAPPPLGPFAYVANKGDDTVSVIDTRTQRQVDSVRLPAQSKPKGIAVTPDGDHVYVANSGTSPGTVSVIEAASNTVTATIGVGDHPSGVAISPDGRRAYVTSGIFPNPGSVSVIDVSRNSVMATLAVQIDPLAVAFTPDSARAYVTNHGSGTVSLLDAIANTVILPPIRNVVISGRRVPAPFSVVCLRRCRTYSPRFGP